MLELLVAIGLLSLLAAAVGGFTFVLFDREERTLALAERTHAAGLLFDRLERDLLTAVAETPDGPGLVGDERSLMISCRAVLAESADPLADDLQITTIRFDQTTRSLTLNRTGRAHSEGENDAASTPDDFSLDDPFGLDPFGLDPFGLDEQDTDLDELSGSIADIRFRYHDGRSWRSSFSSSAGLPVAVELAIWFGPYAGDGTSTDASVDPGAATDAGSDPFAASPQDTGSVLPFYPATDPDGFGSLFPESAENGQPSLRSSTPDRVRIIAIPDAAVPPETGLAGTGPASFTTGGTP